MAARSYCVQIAEKIVEFSSSVLPTPSPYYVLTRDTTVAQCISVFLIHSLLFFSYDRKLLSIATVRVRRS